jgi:hypothetical protein
VRGFLESGKGKGQSEFESQFGAPERARGCYLETNLKHERKEYEHDDKLPIKETSAANLPVDQDPKFARGQGEMLVPRFSIHRATASILFSQFSTYKSKRASNQGALSASLYLSCIFMPLPILAARS